MENQNLLNKLLNIKLNHSITVHQVRINSDDAQTWRCFCIYSAVFVFQVCLGAEAEDKFHMVEVEGLTYDGKSTKVPLVVLKPSVLPSVSERQS